MLRLPIWTNPCDKIVGEIEAAGFTTARAYAMDMSDNAAIAATAKTIIDDLGGWILSSIMPAWPCRRRLTAMIIRPIGRKAWPSCWKARKCLSVKLAALRASDSARIVNIASTEGLGGSAGNRPIRRPTWHYRSHKRLAIELGKQGITVNAVCPGPIHTGITEAIPDAHKATFAHRRTALRRYGEPEEVAHITLSLCLPAASYVTGVAIPVDGMRARNN